mmetsp:Transcript_31867/g.110159  ORF Transcript_31867/g.110159 Transcript_31867/m.110159 type:complete len:85 (-) Transcript_31867:1560-1814(-)
MKTAALIKPKHVTPTRASGALCAEALGRKQDGALLGLGAVAASPRVGYWTTRPAGPVDADVGMAVKPMDWTSPAGMPSSTSFCE